VSLEPHPPTEEPERSPRFERPLRGAAPGAERIATRRGTSGGRRVALVAGVRLTHADRAMYPGVTKEDVARYYEAIAARVVPHLAGRPLTLVRCPDGVGGGCAYLRHARSWGPSALRRIAIAERTKVGEYLVADSLAALIALVQMDVLEIHTWSSVDRDLERPDRLVFDLDPAEGVGWPRVVEAARRVRAALAALDLAAFVKTTGGKGLHVVTPLAASAGWDDCLAFSRAIARAIAADDPARYLTRVSKTERFGRILIDYLRNARGNTAVAAFSTRARPEATVSMPLAWTELDRADPARFTVRTVPTILARRRRDPWRDYEDSREPLTPARLRAVRS